MKIDADGFTHSRREILVVDRTRDPDLARPLDYARSTAITGRHPIERAALLAIDVDERTSPRGGAAYRRKRATYSKENTAA